MYVWIWDTAHLAACVGLSLIPKKKKKKKHELLTLIE